MLVAMLERDPLAADVCCLAVGTTSLPAFSGSLHQVKWHAEFYNSLLHLGTSHRIELRVALIQYLPTALPVLHSQDLVVAKLLGVFEKLAVQTQPFQIREGVAASVMKLWPLVLRGRDFAALHSCCKLTLCLLQDADADVRSEMATTVGKLLTSMSNQVLLLLTCCCRHVVVVVVV